MSYNQIYPGFAYSLYMFYNCNYCSNAFMDVFACIQSSIVSLRVVKQQEKGYVVDAQNITSNNENDQVQHSMVYKAK